MDSIDLHIHSKVSDGYLSPEKLISKAYSEGIRHIALTDHNRIHTNIEYLRTIYPDMEIISGSEISGEWFTKSGEKKEIHVIGLFLDQTEELKEFLEKNCDNGIERLEQMLKILSDYGINFDGCLTYQHFKSRFFPDRTFIGRVQLAQVAVSEEFSYASTVDEFMDEFIGDYGKRRAYVPSNHVFASLQTVVEKIHENSGIAILAHPKSFKLTDENELIEYFQSIGGDGMECWYSHYSYDECKKLEQISIENGLLPSCASDYHGNRGTDEQLGHYPVKYLEKLRERHLYYKQRNK